MRRTDKKEGYMKYFTTLKVGYTAGIYGCSNEFFTTIYVDDQGLHFFSFKGMYGPEERISRALKAKGYEEKWVASDFGKMKTREVSPIFMYKSKALELLNNIK